MDTILKMSPAVLFRWIAARDWPVVYVSGNISRFGYRADELLTNEVTFGSIIHPDDFQTVSQKIKELSEKQMDQLVQEYRIITKDDRVCWVEDRRKAEYDPEGNITHYQGVVLDITDRKTIDKKWKLAQDALDHYKAAFETSTRKLTKAQEQAEASTIAKNNFLSHMSHELRTPLNAVLGFSRLMQRDQNLTAKQTENLKLIYQSGEHLRKLIEGVLDMSRIDAGLESLDIETIDLPRFIQGIAVMFKSRAADRGLTFSLEMMPGLPQLVMCDEHRLQQILTNLMDNSLKFTDTGGIDIKIWHSHAPTRQKGVRPSEINTSSTLFFRIRDTGKGIAPEQLDQVFDPFFRGDTHCTSVAGIGLGLTISRNFARLMGGDIIATNRQGPGAAFTLNIDARLAAPSNTAPEKTSSEVIAILSGQTQSQPHAQQKTPGLPIDELAELPMALLENLNQKALELDLEEINTCMDEIGVLNAPLGESLKALSKRFRYNDILDLTEQAIYLKKQPV
jgi:PAS domain S-box-containing protein